MVKKSSKNQYWWREFDKKYQQDLERAGKNVKLKNAVISAYKTTKKNIKENFEKSYRNICGEQDFQKLMKIVGQKKWQ